MAVANHSRTAVTGDRRKWRTCRLRLFLDVIRGEMNVGMLKSHLDSRHHPVGQPIQDHLAMVPVYEQGKCGQAPSEGYHIPGSLCSVKPNKVLHEGVDGICRRATRLPGQREE